jgi:hypothetical protein
MSRIPPAIPYNPISFETTEDCAYAVTVLRDLASAFGFRDQWAYCARYIDPPLSFGLDRHGLRQLYREADAILNICGAQELHEELLESDRLIYVESDPGFEQIKVDQNNKEARN